MRLVNHKLGVRPDIQKYQPRVFERIPDLIWGSPAHDEYWERERDRCINGYKPKGMNAITGAHYFILNYCFIKVKDPTALAKDDRLQTSLPWYRDNDHEYLNFLDECKANRTGAIVAKARDKGFSVLNVGKTQHELTFYEHAEVGAAAGLDVTIQSFVTKLMLNHRNLPPEFRNNIMVQNDDEIKSGFEWNDRGQWIEDGMQSILYTRTMGMNPNVFKGERVGLMIFEEAGEFKKLIEGFKASEPCFRDGADQFGLPIVGGTGGNILNASADFKNMWYEHESFNLQRFFVPVTKVYKGFFDFTSGVSDEIGAKEFEVKLREKKKKSGQLAYNLHIQNYPFTPEESFLKSTGSPFNLMKINDQRGRILSDRYLKFQVETGYLDWEDENMHNQEGKLRQLAQGVSKTKVRFRPHPDGPIKILLHPDLDANGEQQFYNLDIGGIDSFDQEEAGSSDSEGAVVIYRRFKDINSPHNLPIATLKFRSNRSYEFYEMALKMAVYYNCKMLIEYTKIGIIDYFVRNNAQRYLKEKPRSVHDPNTTTRNKWGCHMNSQIKSLGIELMAEDIDQNCEDNWFIELLDDLADFGSRNTDLAMAYMMCVIHNFDIAKIRVIEQREIEEVEDYGFAEWESQNGTLVKKR